MIDSSVGGKTAINVPAGKNLIGAFYQPVDVYADLDLLKSLGKREIVEGICEAIKMGCIHKPKLFELLEAHPEEVTDHAQQRAHAPSLAPSPAPRPVLCGR